MADDAGLRAGRPVGVLVGVLVGGAAWLPVASIAGLRQQLLWK
jgi:hypothetical protein